MHLSRKRRHGTTEPRKTRSWRDPRSTFMASRKRRARTQERQATVNALQIKTARVFASLLGPCRNKGAKGGRGSGKSHFFAELLVERCVMVPSTRAVCLREVQTSLTESSKRLIEDKIEALGVQSHFDVKHDVIHVLDGAKRRRGIIIFRGMQKATAQSIKSLEGYDVAWFEEAQVMSALSLSLLRPTLRKEGSELWFSWNPSSPKDAVDAYFEENKDDVDFECVTANFYDNPWFPDELRKEMLRDKERDHDRYLHIWEGQYARLSQARVFKKWRIGTAEEFETKEFLKLIPRYGADWGYANDPNVAVKVRLDTQKRIMYVEREVYQIGCEIEDTPALFDQLDEGEIRNWPCRADSARPETISYLQRHGYPRLRAAVKGKNSVKEGVQFIKNYDVVIHPLCKHTADEFLYYSWKVDEKTEEVLPILEDKKNHVIDSIRYAIEGVRHIHKAGVLF